MLYCMLYGENLKKMTKTIDNLNKVTFNYYMTDALKHNKGISFGILNPGSHAITLGCKI